jgi:diguanylate cyclase (GGDEF)-like protein
MPSDREFEVVRAALVASRELSRAGFLQGAVQQAVALFGGAIAAGYRPSRSGHELELEAWHSSEALLPLRGAMAIQDATLFRQLSGGRPVLFPEAETLLVTGEALDGTQLDAALLIPLIGAESFVGALIVIATPRASLRDDAEQVAAAWTAELKPLLDNLLIVESLRELVIRDDTADCYNRRHLDTSLDDETERARRFAGRYSLIFLDTDNLKEINTRWGHATGSRALYEASVRINRRMRSIDRLFRYGGDEFVVLLPGTSLDGAREVAERVGRELASPPMLMPTGEQMVMTMSMGVAGWPEHGPDARSVIEAADAAMRGVKAHGKNGVAIAPIVPSET